MSSTESPGGAASSFHHELLALWRDPKIWRLAVRRAGSRDLALDALQDTFYTVARVKDPDHIENLPAFFRTALTHEIDHQRRWELRACPMADPETAAGDPQQGFRRQGFPW